MGPEPKVDWSRMAEERGYAEAMRLARETPVEQEQKPPFHDFAGVLFDERRVNLSAHNFIVIKDEDMGYLLLMVPRYDGDHLLILATEASSVHHSENPHAHQIAQEFGGIAVDKLLVQAVVRRDGTEVNVVPFLQYPTPRLVNEATTNAENVDMFLRPRNGYSVAEAIIGTGRIVYPRPGELHR